MPDGLAIGTPSRTGDGSPFELGGRAVIDDPAPRLHLDASRFRELTEAVLGSGGRLWVQGWGRSMLPTLLSGDRILLEFPPARLPIGTIVLVDRQGHFVLHRVVAIRGSHLLIRGDGQSGPVEWTASDRVVAVALAAARDGALRALVPTLEFGWLALLRYGAALAGRRARDLRARVRFGAARPSPGGD